MALNSSEDDDVGSSIHARLTRSGRKHKKSSTRASLTFKIESSSPSTHTIDQSSKRLRSNNASSQTFVDLDDVAQSRLRTRSRRNADPKLAFVPRDSPSAPRNSLAKDTSHSRSSSLVAQSPSRSSSSSQLNQGSHEKRRPTRSGLSKLVWEPLPVIQYAEHEQLEIQHRGRKRRLERDSAGNVPDLLIGRSKRRKVTRSSSSQCNGSIAYESTASIDAERYEKQVSSFSAPSPRTIEQPRRSTASTIIAIDVENENEDEDEDEKVDENLRNSSSSTIIVISSDEDDDEAQGDEEICNDDNNHNIDPLSQPADFGEDSRTSKTQARGYSTNLLRTSAIPASGVSQKDIEEQAVIGASRMSTSSRISSEHDSNSIPHEQADCLYSHAESGNRFESDGKTASTPKTSRKHLSSRGFLETKLLGDLLKIQSVPSFIKDYLGTDPTEAQLIVLKEYLESEPDSNLVQHVYWEHKAQLLINGDGPHEKLQKALFHIQTPQSSPVPAALSSQSPAKASDKPVAGAQSSASVSSDPSARRSSLARRVYNGSLKPALQGGDSIRQSEELSDKNQLVSYGTNNQDMSEKKSNRLVHSMPKTQAESTFQIENPADDPRQRHIIDKLLSPRKTTTITPDLGPPLSTRRGAVSGKPHVSAADAEPLPEPERPLARRPRKYSLPKLQSEIPEEDNLVFDAVTCMANKHVDDLAAQQIADEEAEHYRHQNYQNGEISSERRSMFQLEADHAAKKYMLMKAPPGSEVEVDPSRRRHKTEVAKAPSTDERETPSKLLPLAKVGHAAEAAEFGRTKFACQKTTPNPVMNRDTVDYNGNNLNRVLPYTDAGAKVHNAMRQRRENSEKIASVESKFSKLLDGSMAMLAQLSASRSMSDRHINHTTNTPSLPTSPAFGQLAYMQGAAHNNHDQQAAAISQRRVSISIEAHPEPSSREGDTVVPAIPFGLNDAPLKQHKVRPILRNQIVSRSSPLAQQHEAHSTEPMDIEVDFTARPRSFTKAFEVQEVVDKHLKDLHNDHEYKVRNELKRARMYRPHAPPTLHTKLPSAAPNGMMGVVHNVSPFDAMDPIQVPISAKGKSPKRDQFQLYTETFNRSSGSKPTSKGLVACPILSYDPDDPEMPSYTRDIPSYTHYISLRRNVLGENTKQMHVWPYFRYEGDYVPGEGKVYSNLKNEFDVDVKDWPRKVQRAQQVQTYAPYVEGFLEEIGCTMSDVLYYFLEPNEDIVTFDGCRDRNALCKEDLNRSSQRWVKVLSSLTKPSQDALRKVALACTAFSEALPRFTLHSRDLTLWHIARKSQAARLQEDQGRIDTSTRYCQICYTHDCPYHGEVREWEHSDEDDDNDTIASDDARDADYPPKINFKIGVTLPDMVDTVSKSEVPRAFKHKHKKTLDWWLENSLTWDHTKRGPFYPCHHPGQSCDQAECRCYRDKVCCEKACHCSTLCDRRFQGCSCKRGGKKRCLQDDRCECFKLNRECDPDLCGTCGVDLILDRENQGRQGLSSTCCRNAGIQLGVSKRTILGASKVHGFGLFAGEPIRKDEFVGEYMGEIIGQAETERRGAIYEVQRLSYLFALNRDQEVDSQRMGNKTRFINHAGQNSKFRNVYPKIMLCNMAHRIGFFALKDIPVKSELFFDYGKDYHQHLVDRDVNEPDEEVVPKTKNRALVNTFDDPVDGTSDHQEDLDDPAQDLAIPKRASARKGRATSNHALFISGHRPVSNIPATRVKASQVNKHVNVIAPSTRVPAARKSDKARKSESISSHDHSSRPGLVDVPRLDPVPRSPALKGFRVPGVSRGILGSAGLQHTSNSGRGSPLKTMHTSRATSVDEDCDEYMIDASVPTQMINVADESEYEDDELEIADSEEDGADASAKVEDTDEDSDDSRDERVRRSLRDRTRSTRMRANEG